MLRYLCLSVFIAIAHAGWEGHFSAPWYGGGLSVCLSHLMNGQTIGQGVFSSLGYMRGQVVDNVWNGTYYLGGIEGRHGMFVLEQSPNGSFIGNFTQMDGVNHFTFPIGGDQMDDVTPNELECFKADDNYLVPHNFSFHGRWEGGGLHGWDIVVNKNSHEITSSYNYSYAPHHPAFGVEHGHLMEDGLIAQTNFYENGNPLPFSGIDLIVAKNSTAFYAMFWNFPTVSAFDYSRFNESAFCGQSIFRRNRGHPVGTKDAHQNVCSSLWGSEDQVLCNNGVHPKPNHKKSSPKKNQKP